MVIVAHTFLQKRPDLALRAANHEASLPLDAYCRALDLLSVAGVVSAATAMVTGSAR